MRVICHFTSGRRGQRHILGDHGQLQVDLIEDPAEFGEALTQFPQSPDQHVPHTDGGLVDGRRQRHLDRLDPPQHPRYLCSQDGRRGRTQCQVRLELRRQRVTQVGLPGLAPTPGSQPVPGPDNHLGQQVATHAANLAQRRRHRRGAAAGTRRYQ